MKTLSALASIISAEAIYEVASHRSASTAPQQVTGFGALDMMMRRCELRKPNFIHR